MGPAADAAGWIYLQPWDDWDALGAEFWRYNIYTDDMELLVDLDP